ncbi:beat protein-like protein 2 [Sarcoptes scabiei]|uniref:Beat protein-like protein 2 n=1 Tax=Sarcoptes scabiei TaxID=52283 RepID=A0A132A4C7_SARSC|nr:beat protein-like protein 2 [Sarcoptes scabiei]
MKIYVLPDRNVQIHGIKDQYNYGDNISLVCKAGKSWPPIQLVWLINGLTVRGMVFNDSFIVLTKIYRKYKFRIDF